MSFMHVVLVTGGYDHKIRFWDASSGNCSKSISFNDSQVNCLEISHDKSLLVAGGNPSIQLFDVQASDERPVVTYDGHTTNVTTVGFNKDQRWIFSSSEDGSVRVWDTRSNNHTRKYEAAAPVNTVLLHPSRAELISGDQSGAVKIWDLTADKCREEYVPLVDVPVRSVSMVRCWTNLHLATHSITRSAFLSAMQAFDGSIMAVGSHKGKVFIYSPDGDKLHYTVTQDFQAHEDYLLKCVISPDMKSVATASADKTVKLWNTEHWTLDSTLNKHQRWVWDCVFSADSVYLLTASSDQSAKLWDLRTGDVVRNYVGHNLAVTCVALNDISTT